MKGENVSDLIDIEIVIDVKGERVSMQYQSYDKNENGRIDGISELFGNINESGFEELKRLIDSNHDNTIDRKDELFSRLQVWRDKNQDAVVQEGELTSLKDEGVSSINLNLVETNIELNGNLLTEASKYTDSQGNKELVADIQLATDTKDTKVNIEDIPNFSIDESTRDLANIKGSGLVYDSFILYNIDPEFKALAELYTNDSEKAMRGFDTYVEQLSGYTNYINELKEKYSLSDDFTMQESDKKAWIAERFLAEDNFTTTIENYYESNLNNDETPNKPIVNNSTINIRYTNISQKIQSTFMILSHYKDEFADTHYDIDTDRFIIDDEAAFNSKVTNYFNNPDKTIEEKVQLAKIMQTQREGLNFDINEVVTSIENDITQTFISDTFSQRNLVLGTTQDDTLSTDDSKSKILLNTGDDIIQSGKGINTFYFRRGDGSDVVGDAGGLDKLNSLNFNKKEVA